VSNITRNRAGNDSTSHVQVIQAPQVSLSPGIYFYAFLSSEFAIELEISMVYSPLSN